MHDDEDGVELLLLEHLAVIGVRALEPERARVALGEAAVEVTTSDQLDFRVGAVRLEPEGQEPETRIETTCAEGATADESDSGQHG